MLRKIIVLSFLFCSLFSLNASAAEIQRYLLIGSMPMLKEPNPSLLGKYESVLEQFCKETGSVSQLSNDTYLTSTLAQIGKIDTSAVDTVAVFVVLEGFQEDSFATSTLCNSLRGILTGINHNLSQKSVVLVPAKPDTSAIEMGYLYMLADEFHCEVANSPSSFPETFCAELLTTLKATNYRKTMQPMNNDDDKRTSGVAVTSDVKTGENATTVVLQMEKPLQLKSFDPNVEVGAGRRTLRKHPSVAR